MFRSFRFVSLPSLTTIAALILSACGAGQPSVTPAGPVVQIPEGLTVSTNPTALPPDFGLQLVGIPLEELASTTNPQWATALAALPESLRLASPFYQLTTTGQSPAQVFISVVVPTNAPAGGLDLYGWDDKTWSFIPARLQGNQMVAEVTHIPQALGLFETTPRPPLAYVTLEPGQTLHATASAAVNGVLLGGPRIQPNGAVTGQLPNTTFDSALARYPLVRNYDEYGPDIAGLSALLIDAAVRANHLQSLLAFGNQYDGLVLDYRGLNEALAAPFAQFVTDLATQLHAQNRLLFVVAPEGQPLRALAAADAVFIPLPTDPQALTTGGANQTLAQATSELERGRLRLLTSALSVDELAGHFTHLAEDAALADFGTPALTPALSGDLTLGQPLTLTLTGRARGLAYDPAAFAMRYLYRDEAASEHTVWLTSAETMRQRLALAAQYGLGGVVVTDLLAPGVPENVATAITQYKVNLPAAELPAPVLQWTVGDGVNIVAQGTTLPNEAFAFTPAKPGDYKISAELRLARSVALGAVDVKVVKAATSATGGGSSTNGSAGGSSTGGGTTSGSGNSGGSGSSSGSGSSGGSSSGSTGGGGFVPPPPIVAGNFELGGQVPGYISHADIMRQSGMTWVKMQAGDPAGSIAAGHAAGFRVLISAVGDRSRAADPAYWPEYAQWVAGIAAMGADAIEVWNEMNLDREWPNGQISGTNYTEMLKQAYAAIKAANPGTLVIAGAPAPTGAAGSAGCTPAFCNDDVFLQQMASAGAANYMDCVGVHFNSGSTSPRVSTGATLSGYHYSYYFWPMVDLYYNAFGGSRPLCFTELGYMSPEGYSGVELGIFSWAAGITVAQQAQWLAEGASLSASSGKVKMMIVFNVDFTVMHVNDPQAGYAMLRPDGSCPACNALDAVMP